MPPCFSLQRKVNTLGLHLQYHPLFFYRHLHRIFHLKSVLKVCFERLSCIVSPNRSAFPNRSVFPNRSGYHYNERIAPEGLFLINPTMVDGREATGSLRGGETDATQLGRRPCRCTSAPPHPRTPAPPSCYRGKRRETWSPTKQYRTGLSPRRRSRLSPTPSIVGLVRNSLSEATSPMQ